MVTVNYFGRLGDLAGCMREQLDVPKNVKNTSDFRKFVDAEKQMSGALLEDSVRIAVNNEVVKDPWPINSDDEVSFMPPVGGG